MKLKASYKSLKNEYTKINCFIDKKLEATLNQFDKILDPKR